MPNTFTCADVAGSCGGNGCTCVPGTLVCTDCSTGLPCQG
jgi:hypothetical protein